MKESLTNSVGIGISQFICVETRHKLLIAVLAVSLFIWSFEQVALAQSQGSADNVRVELKWTGLAVLALRVIDPCGNELGRTDFVTIEVTAECRGVVGNYRLYYDGDETNVDEIDLDAIINNVDEIDLGELRDELEKYSHQVVWEQGTPVGEYSVHVDNFIGVETTYYTVTIEYDNQTDTVRGEFPPLLPSDFSMPTRLATHHVTGFATTSTVSEPVASFASSSSSTAEGSGTHNITVALSPAPSSNVTLAYTLEGTAMSGDDYRITGVTNQSGTVEVFAGASTVNIPVVITEDNAVEGDETIVLTLTGGMGYTVGSPDDHMVTIEDNDVPPVDPVASFALSSSSTDESSGTHNVTINLSPAPQSNVTVAYWGRGTAVLGSDFSITGVTRETGGEIEVSAGTSTVNIPVTIIDDNAVEENETLVLTLRDGTGYTVGSPNGHTVTIADNDTRSVVLPTSPLSVVEGQRGTYSIGLTSRPDGDDEIIVTPQSDNSHVSFTPRSLTFNAETGNAPQQVSFVVTDDNQDDTLTISHDVEGYGDLTDGGTVTVNVVPSSTTSEPEEKALVKDTVKAVAASAVANVSANIGARFSGSPGGAAPALTLAGVPVGAGMDWRSGEEVLLQRRGAPDLWDEAEGRPRVWSPSMTDLLRGSAFQVALGAAESGAGIGGIFSGVTMWGRGDMVRLESDAEKEGSYDGRILAGYLGLDKRVTNQWTLGVAASRIGVSADYALESGKGELELNLTGVHPYARFASAQGTELSVILGWSSGEIENVREGAAEREATDTKLFMAGAGGRQKVASGILGGMDVALLGDVGYGQVSGESDEALETLDDLMIDTLRVRAGVEGSYTKALETGATLTPFVELAGRYDGGSGDDSSGMEVAGGVTYAAPAQGLGLQARAYALVLSSRSDYREYGASATVSLTSRQRGQGLSVSVTPRLGRPSEGADALWRTDPFALSGQPREPEFALDARVEYGVAGLAFGGTVTPFTELQWLGDDRRRVRAGVRIGRKALAGRGLDVRFYGERTTDAGDDADDRINLLANWRF